MWDFHLCLINGDPDMKRKRYSEEQIISVLKQHEAGRSMVDLAREYGIPTVVGVRRATEQIRPGAVLRVDGDRGVVRIVD